MRRWHQEYAVSHRQWKIHHKDHVETNKRGTVSYDAATMQMTSRVGKDPYEVDCVCDEQIGRFRKTDAWDCGNPKCGICHSDKFPKRQLTMKEEKSNLSFKEQLKDY